MQPLFSAWLSQFQSLIFRVVLQCQVSWTHIQKISLKFNKYQGRYVIVHTEYFDCHFAQCVVDDRLKIITGNQVNISKNHQNHENSKKWLNHYNVFTEKPMNEVHIYMQEGVAYEDLFHDVSNSNLMELSFDDIKKVEFHKCQNGINSVIYMSTLLLGMTPLILVGIEDSFDWHFNFNLGPI